MIIQIDDHYFNPMQITQLIKVQSDVHIYFSNDHESYLKFKNWNINDLAAEINLCIEEFKRQS
jgi:hypothetical protein